MSDLLLPQSREDGEAWLGKRHSQKQFLLVALENGPDVMEDGWGEQVDATVDELADKRAGFFHVVQDLKKKSVPWVGQRKPFGMTHTVVGTALPDPRIQQAARRDLHLPRACQHLPRCTRSSGTVSDWPTENADGHQREWRAGEALAAEPVPGTAEGKPSKGSCLIPSQIMGPSPGFGSWVFPWKCQGLNWDCLHAKPMFQN